MTRVFSTLARTNDRSFKQGRIIGTFNDEHPFQGAQVLRNVSCRVVGFITGTLTPTTGESRMEENPNTGVARNGGGKIEDTATQGTGDARTKLEEKLDQASGKIQSIIGGAVDALGDIPIADRASSLVKQATAAGAKAASSLEDAAHTVSDQASDIGGRLYDDARRAAESLGRTVEEQPLTSVFIAAALGYGIAYLMHRR
jgi:ElaB/YqjD/DUF883 family membrane-anchored ribosome-binding protein